MLIDTPYKENDVISIKLTSGEELVAKLLAEDANFATISKPLSLTATQQGMGLTPFMFTVDPEAKFKINQASIVCIVKTLDEMASNYIQSTTGLKI